MVGDWRTWMPRIDALKSETWRTGADTSSARPACEDTCANSSRTLRSSEALPFQKRSATTLPLAIAACTAAGDEVAFGVGSTPWAGRAVIRTGPWATVTRVAEAAASLPPTAWVKPAANIPAASASELAAALLVEQRGAAPLSFADASRRPGPSDPARGAAADRPPPGHR